MHARRPAPLAEALAERLTAITVDRRGRGDSDDRAAPPPYDVEREVEDVAAVVEAVGGAAAVYGHSSGAALALRAAAADIGVARLVVHDAPYNLPGDEQSSLDWHTRLHALLDAGRHGDAIAAFLTIVGLPARRSTVCGSAALARHGGGRADPRVRLRGDG